MTAEEYVKHYTSGQGGYESVPVDIALRAIEYAKQEMKQQMMANAIDGMLYSTICGSEQNIVVPAGYGEYGKDGDQVKVLVIKEE